MSEPVQCAACEGDVPQRQGYWLEVGRDGHESAWKWFCSWEHLQEWVADGEPELPALSVATLVDRVFAVGCVAVLLLLVTVFGVGAVTVIRAMS